MGLSFLAVFVCEVAAMEVSQKKPAAGAPAAKEPAPTLASGKYTFSKAEALRRYVLRKQHKSGKGVSAAKRAENKKKALYVEKPFNKGTRIVSLKKRPNNYPVKTLKSGLLLVAGPYKINRVPVRRVHQHYVIATSAKLAVDKVEVPASIDDAYFRRIREKRLKKAEGDIFAQKKKGYKPSAQRKADQIVVDKQVLESIKSHPDRKILLAYLKTPFGLSTGQYPHTMKF